MELRWRYQAPAARPLRQTAVTDSGGGQEAVVFLAELQQVVDDLASEVAAASREVEDKLGQMQAQMQAGLTLVTTA